LHYAAKYGQLSAAAYIVEQADSQLNALNDVRVDVSRPHRSMIGGVA